MLLLLGAATPTALRAQTGDPAAGPGTVREFRADAFTKDDGALRLRLSPERSSLTLAQRLTVRLEVRMPVGWQVTWPTIGAELGAFTVVSVSEPSTSVIQSAAGQGGEAAAGQQTVGVSVKRTLVLEPVDADKHEIPAMEFAFTPPSGVIGKAITLRTEPVGITVTSLLEGAATVAPDPGKGRGIAPIDPGFLASARLFVDEHRTTIIIGGAAAVMGVSALWFVAVRRRRDRSLTPEQAARRRLGRVVVANDSPVEAIGGAMVELADILREYAAARFNLPQADRTTEELLADLGALQGVPSAELGQMLRQFDQVKFAGATAHAPDVRAAVADVAGFVESTSGAAARPEAVPLPAAAPSAAAPDERAMSGGVMR